MAALVDTSILIEFLRRVPAAVAWFEGQTDPLTISVITVLELYAGARSQHEERDIAALCQRLACLPVGREIAERAGALMRHFHRTHGIDVPDAIIAATAEHHGLPLATLNVKHFPMFPKLKRPY
jgi:predicted nucleic acid-binding protein